MLAECGPYGRDTNDGRRLVTDSLWLDFPREWAKFFCFLFFCFLSAEGHPMKDTLQAIFSHTNIGKVAKKTLEKFM